MKKKENGKSKDKNLRKISLKEFLEDFKKKSKGKKIISRQIKSTNTGRSYQFAMGPSDEKEDKSDVKKNLEKRGLDTHPEYSISIFDYLKSRKKEK